MRGFLRVGSGTFRSGARALAAATLLAVASASAARAQADADTQAQIRNVFQQLYADPGNTELTYRYAQLQTQARNYEAAVAALERLLLINPNQPQLKFALGVLYFRMGSYAAARTYLQQALDAPDTPPEIQARIREFMAEAERRTSRHSFTGSVTLGLRYETNANFATSATTVQASGIQINNPDHVRDDFSGVLIGRATHVYDFQTNDSTAWVSNLLVYGTRHVDVGTSNIILTELMTGPRFQVLRETWRGSTLRPYFITNVVGLDDRNYSHAFGGGIDLSIPFGNRWALETTYQFRAIDYNNIFSQPTASVLTGNENLIRARVAYQVTPDSAMFGELSGRFVSTRQNSFDFNEFGVVATYTQDYRVVGSRPWNITGSAAYYRRNYGAPDPVVNPTVTRLENEYRFGVANVIPVAENWYLVQQFDAVIIDGNLANYDRRDYVATAAVRWRF